jgi:hypothetical protein
MSSEGIVFIGLDGTVGAKLMDRLFVLAGMNASTAIAVRAVAKSDVLEIFMFRYNGVGDRVCSIKEGEKIVSKYSSFAYKPFSILYSK